MATVNGMVRKCTKVHLSKQPLERVTVSPIRLYLLGSDVYVGGKLGLAVIVGLNDKLGKVDGFADGV